MVQVTKCPSPEEQTETKPASRLSLPKTTSRRQSTDDTSVGRSKLKPPGLSRSNSTACRPQQIPQRSGLQQPSLKPPAMMKLMKPGSLQRPVHTKLNDSTKKAPTGPMKATIPSTQMSASKKDLGMFHLFILYNYSLCPFLCQFCLISDYFGCKIIPKLRCYGDSCFVNVKMYIII